MATTDAFNMAAPAMVRICLYGDLQRFGKRISLSIKTAAEGIHALVIQLPGFRQRMYEGWYQVRIAGSDMAPDAITARLNEPLPPGAVVHIVPRMAGAKNGIWQVVAGAALIGASFIPGLNAVAAAVLFSAGTSMALGGVAQMLTPVPKTPTV
ncbi:tail assembly protein, partial [Salmonella enterica subsp. enterica serovar Typhimurium]|nr:tail assembly protein [Salmonella enterica subsp. enterica serovar Typhimurium]